MISFKAIPYSIFSIKEVIIIKTFNYYVTNLYFRKKYSCKPNSKFKVGDKYVQAKNSVSTGKQRGFDQI